MQETERVTKRSRGPLIVLTVVIVALAGIGGYFAYQHFVTDTKDSSGSNSNTGGNNDSKNVTPESTSQQLALGLPDVVNGTVSPASTFAEYANYAPFWRPDSSKFNVYPNKDDVHGVHITGTAEEVTSNVAVIDTYLKSKNLAVDQSVTTGTDFQIYSNDDVLCSVISSTTGTAYTVVACADASAYEKAVRDLTPFADAFAQSSEFDAATGLAGYIFGGAVIQMSYPETASVSISLVEGTGWRGMFTGNQDGTWTYTGGSQN